MEIDFLIRLLINVIASLIDYPAQKYFNTFLGSIQLVVKSLVLCMTVWIFFNVEWALKS